MAAERKSLAGADRPLEFPLQWPTRQLCCWDSRGPRGARTFGDNGGAALAQGSPPAQVTHRSAESVSPQHSGWTVTKQPPVQCNNLVNLAPGCLLSARLGLGVVCSRRARCPPDCFETTRKKLIIILLAIRAWLAAKCNAFIKTSFEGAEGSEFEAVGDCRSKRAQLLLGSLNRGEGAEGGGSISLSGTCTFSISL